MKKIVRNIKNALWISSLKINKKAKSKGKGKAIIFVADHLHSSGGVESRTYAYACELEKRGFLPVFVSGKLNNAKIRSRFLCIKLQLKAPNFTDSLIKIAESLDAQTIEYQMTWNWCFGKLDIDKLNARIRTGVVIHGNIPDINYEFINKFNYRILISAGLKEINYTAFPDFSVISNAVEIPSGKLWKYKNQKKALILSRIQKDKEDVLTHGVEFMRKHGIDFEVVGNSNDPVFLEEFQEKLGIPAEKFKPLNVDGPRFMAEHIDDYLFVAGVGLVLFEAGALGYPCLITAGCGADYCTFLTQHSLASGIFSNLTYYLQTPEREAAIVQELDLNNLEKYNLRDVVISEYSIQSRVNTYLPIAMPDA